jgi:hypothetical protein
MQVERGTRSRATRESGGWPLDDTTHGIFFEHFEGSFLNRGVTELDPAPAGSGDGPLQVPLADI